MSERWVTQSEAARLETAAGRAVVQSSISRFLENNPDVPVQRTASGRIHLVEYTKLAAARGGSLAVQDKLQLREAEPSPAPRSQAGDATSRKRAAEAEKAELDLAERKGLVIDRAAVSMAMESAAVAFAQALERRRRTLAKSLAGLTDSREIELELKRADREALGQLSRDLAKAEIGEAIEDEAA